MTSLRVTAAHRAIESVRLSSAARPDQQAGNPSFPDALDSAANAEEVASNSKSPTDPKFEASSAETHSEPRTRAVQKTLGEPARDVTQQTSLVGDQLLSVESPAAAPIAGSVSADQFEPDSDPPSNGPDANAPSMPQAEIRDDDQRRDLIRRSGHAPSAVDAPFADAIIYATDARFASQSTASSATDGEGKPVAAASLPTSGGPSLDLPAGRPRSQAPAGSLVESASSFPCSPSPDSGPNDAATISAGHLAVTSPAREAGASVPRATSVLSPAPVSSGIEFGPDALRGAEAIAASPPADAAGSARKEISAFSPDSASSGIDPGADTLRRVPEITASVASEGIIAAPDISAPRTRGDPRSAGSASLVPGTPDPITGNSYLAGSQAQGSAPSSPSNLQPVGLAEQLARHVVTSIDNGGREVVLQLHPPELGSLTVRVLVSGRDVSAWFGSQQIPVQQAINEAIGQLHIDLGNAGYNLNGAWVGADASGSRGWDDRSFARSRGQSDQSSSQGSPVPSTPSALSGVSIYV